MINTLSELLKAFIDAEKIVLNKYDIKHSPTIGDMYEGLTKDLVNINKSIFAGLNLVVSTQSFIDGCDTEFDVILAEGEGETVPHTSSKKYQPSQVIAVFQVKKKLNSEELKDSYDNLKDVVKVFQNNNTNMNASLVNDSLIKICHKDIVSYERGLLNPQEENIYQPLAWDSSYPLRIILGYNGYKTEEGLRKAFVNFLENNVSNETTEIMEFLPMTFPNLIISDGFSLVKLIGCPYCCPLSIVEDGWWEVVASTHYNSMHVFLETLWTKLSYRFHSLPLEIFGDDLETEPFSFFLRTKTHLDTDEKIMHWDYKYVFYGEKNLINNNDLQEWVPAIVDKAQFVVLRELVKQDIDISQDNLSEAFVQQNGYASIQDFISSLEQLGFATLDGSKLRLLTKKLDFVILPDGNTYAADNHDGRLNRWMLKKAFEKQSLIIH